ncbi:MAG: fused response regulator/phosphatase, partial [Thioalkalispiraceae bacterium]
MSTQGRGLALIVDDNKTNRVILEALLIKNGFGVILAENGKQAVELFRKNKIDIIFMDVMMPEMDGYQATQVIKSICKEKNIFIPVIFLTALNDESSLSKCIEVGGDDFISKPYNITILKSKIIAMERVRDLWRKLNAMYARLQSDEEVAEKVFSSAVLADNIQNREIRSIVKSADIFSGDMFVTAYSPSRDLNILLGDFTGHGLASALGALPASEVFRAMTAKGYSLSDILKTINKKLSNLLPTNMFMACEAISIDSSLKHVTVCNCGMPPVFILSDKNISSIKSTCLPLGIDINQEYIEHLQFIDTEINDRIILLSDGVVDARNENNEEFGEIRLL